MNMYKIGFRDGFYKGLVLGATITFLLTVLIISIHEYYM